MRSLTALLLLLTATACAGDSTPDIPVIAVDTSVSGVVYVRNNPDSAALQASRRYELSHVIAPPEGSPGELSEMRSFTADSLGNVYVLQTNPAVVRVFDSLGNWQRDIGREGDGPGELRSGMLGVSGDTLYLQDWRARRLTTFTTDGAVHSVHPSRCCTSMPRLPVFAGGLVGVPGPARGESFWYLMNSAGVVADSFPLDPFGWSSAPTAWRAMRRTGNNEQVRQIMPPNTVFTHATLRRDRTTAWGATSAYAIAIGTPPRDTSRVFTMPFSARRLSEAERKALFESVFEAMEPEWATAFREVASLDDVPAELPAWDMVMTDGDDVMVVMLDETRLRATVDRFAPDGTFQYRASLPTVAAGYAGMFLDDKLYARQDDENGFPTIHVYRMVRSSGATAP
jgi:hypothetical protein